MKLLYKYRFGSIELLKVSLELSVGPSLYRKLETLCDRGYIGKRYESSYKIRGLPAAYCVLAKGLQELQKLPGYEPIDEKVIKYSYKDKTVSQAFISHNLQVYRTAIELQRLYPAIKFFTRRELTGRKHFPKNLPDAFVSLQAENTAKPRRYFLDLIPDSTPRYVIDKRIGDYYEFFETGGWEATKSPLPAMLLLCESGSFEKRLQQLVSRKRRSLDSDEPEYFTSTLSALKSVNADSKIIWSNVDQPDEPQALDVLN